MRLTTPGKLLIETAIPEKYLAGLSSLTKKDLAGIFTRIAKEEPDKYEDIMANFTDVSRAVVYKQGREASVGLDDLSISDKLRSYRNSVRENLRKIQQNPYLKGSDKNKAIVDYMYKEMGVIPNKVVEDASARNSAFYAQVQSGARGNKSQLQQCVFGDGLLVDAENHPVPIPVTHSYAEGVKPMEFWAASSGARKGSIDVQFATADGGYLGKQLSNLGHRMVVTQKDCGTKQALPVDAQDIENIGSVLARDTNGIPAGTIITKDNIGKLGKGKILVRSLATCGCQDGVCSVCAGVREKNTLPPIGDPIGIVAARAISEPITQAGLKSKHTGGVAGMDDKKVHGFEELNQFIQVPSSFKGAATLSEIDGVVTAIKDAPAGGKFVVVNDKQFYVPRDTEVIVKKGDTVTAGDMLSEGTPNPGELVKYKGIGDGRKYFIEKYRELLDKNGSSVHRRNIEAVARGFVNRVQISDLDGYNGYMVNDVVPYDSFAYDYEPRPDSKDLDPGMSRNKFLERPVLHYSIGTRVTPAVIKTLKENKISKITVNDKEPVFTPYIVRTKSLLQTDPDWQTQLAGENLKKTLLQDARLGATSTPEGTSYFPSMANPTTTELYKGGDQNHNPLLKENYVKVI